MESIVEIEEIPEGFILVTDSQEVDAIRESILGEAAAVHFNPAALNGTWLEGLNREERKVAIYKFDSFFVKIGDGYISEAYGFYGCVPYNDKTAYRLL